MNHISQEEDALAAARSAILDSPYEGKDKITKEHGWIGVDLDGTLAAYGQGDYIPTEIGEPLQPMVERVKRWIAAGWEVQIVTARVAPPVGHRQLLAIRDAIAKWTKKHIGVALPSRADKDFRMIELWDDRAVQVEPNTGEAQTRYATYIDSRVEAIEFEESLKQAQGLRVPTEVVPNEN